MRSKPSPSRSRSGASRACARRKRLSLKPRPRISPSSAVTRRSVSCAGPGSRPRRKATARSSSSAASRGIGKSALVDTLRREVHTEGLTRVTLRCSPYHTNSALYPAVEHFKRLAGWQPEDDAAARLAKLESALAPYRLPREEAVPLFASLLSLPLDDAY